MTDPRREIPGVDTLLASRPFALLLGRYPRGRVVAALRDVLVEVRESAADGSVLGGPEGPERYADAVATRLAAADVPSLRRVINATGVVLHTNLGRAPLGDGAVEALTAIARGYSNLEYDLAAGSRGSRYIHCVELLREMTGAEDAVVVNNNAAAVVLALNTLAEGAGVLVSRGELVEIGGGFRIPEILERSGARLVEVGTTNRTRADDYERALGQGIAGILKVHRSNFRITGFTEEASVAELAELASRHGVALVHDLGSGLLLDPALLGLPDEPQPRTSLEAGAHVVTMSGDKLLGGPQAGIVLGTRDVVARMRGNPLCRALRVDKLILAALEATLRLYRDRDSAVREIPGLRMLAATPSELENRARSLAQKLGAAGMTCELWPGSSAVGGGAFPEVALPTTLVVLRSPERPPDQVLAQLREGEPPVIARIQDEAVVIDPRTVGKNEETELVRRLTEVLAAARA
ncbi:MAG: L-seryl-tRNA(Sec) selenium transferase [Gemmatimonadetes bacterium]|nr:L-seryl-tRNA(Sec) selenium transferase [Gemmatimonadota bacterium]